MVRLVDLTSRTAIGVRTVREIIREAELHSPEMSAQIEEARREIAASMQELFASQEYLAALRGPTNRR